VRYSLRGRMVNAWQRRRSEFNHDWLKNRYLPALSKWLNLLDGKIEDPAFESTFLKVIFGQWEEQSPRALKLVQDFEKEMSPRTLLEFPPLSILASSTKAWLGPLVHELWLARYPVRNWIDSAVAVVRSLDMAYERVLECLSERQTDVSVVQVGLCRPVFAEFRLDCHRLARAVEAFPSKVTVT
jgi:hypothetical protein